MGQGFPTMSEENNSRFLQDLVFLQHMLNVFGNGYHCYAKLLFSPKQEVPL